MKSQRRLSDKILSALEQALEDEDVEIAEIIQNALEMALTRQVGGVDFSERRDVSSRILVAFDRLRELKIEVGVV
ncbi:MAG: hypothetical protein U9N14_04285 [Pseudomonadota bacterium]|nr:hypothetical protein [Pseudomonadota bacterium]